MTTALIGVGLFALSCLFTGRLQSFLDDLAVALVSIPIVFLFYELIDEKNHRKMTEYVYQYVDNHTFETVDDAIEAVRLLLDGFMHYFEEGWAEWDDTATETWVRLKKYGRIRLKEDDDDYWPENYSQDDYDRDMLAACDEMEDHDYIFYFDNFSIISHLAETAYIGYQVYSLDLTPYNEEIDELVKNPLVLTHLDEDRLIILLYLNEALRALAVAVHDKSGLFAVTDRKIRNFRCETVGEFTNQLGCTGGCDLYYDDGEFSHLIDQDIIVNANKERLTSVFRLLPDRIPLLGGQINEFLYWAERWMES